MAKRTLPGLGLTGFWPLGTDGWNDENDNNLLMLSAVTQGGVLSRTTALPGSPTDGDIYIVPDGDLVDIPAVRDDGAWVYLTPSAGWRLWVADTANFAYFDGSDWATESHGGGGSGAYDMRFGFTVTPTSDQVIDTVMICRNIDWPADLTGSVGIVGVNPTASFEMTIKDDGVDIATVTVGTGGAFAFETVSNTAKTIAAGSVLTLHAPNSVDATIENLSMTIKGDEA